MPTLDRLSVHAADLVDAYEPGRTAVFAAPDRTLLAVGNRLGADVATDQDVLVARVAAQLERGDARMVLAAIPFEPDRPAALIVPESVDVLAGPRAPLGALVDRPLPSTTPKQSNGYRWQLGRLPSRETYAASVAESLRRIERGDLAKIVLARSLDLTGGGPVEAAAILRRLTVRDPGAYAFGISLPPDGGVQRDLVGASPELLVQRFGRQVVARPLAGSAERSNDPVLDRQRGAGLLSSAKELAEHEFVTDGVREALAPYCRELTVSAPRLIATAAVWHLQTDVIGELADPATSSLELALALHPTPAVCGVPTATARAAISELEGFDRDFYAGVVGWCDRDGDGEWVIAIRCAEIRPESVRLYAGAGVVAGSVPAAEVAETSAKFRTMLEAMGLDDIA
jgi:isochorismate synthase